ncbi:unnamed protein product [Mytilus edulis]|uniref:Reverse transcriptase domain-containing protein n=1 Tax=Mytilus edulis TaxID=6550 RepID=A0A8S3VAW6_MYTED|nr:unnamed protein product [Mytilus edulis]
MNIASTTAQPTADEIAAAMITQLKGAGLHLTDSSGVRLSDDRLSSVCGMRSSATQEAVANTDYQTESQHTLPSSSSNTVHYSLVPPVTSDLSVAGYFTASSPTTQEDQALGIDNSSIGQTASYLLRNTLPLGFNVSEKIRKDIMSDSYVDFVTLSPNFNEDEDNDVLFKSKAVKISTYAKPKQLFSIHQWTAAFDIYMSIYYVNHQEHILSLIKYAYNVRAMSKQFGFNMAKSYDETFRKWILNSKFQIRGVSHLLDDFFFVGEANTNKCSVALNTFLTLSKTLGVPIKDEKTQLPTTCIIIYGIEIDSRAMVARLPKDKIAKILGLLNIFKVKKKVILRELQSLLGLLNFACSVVVPGRAFLRRLFDLTIGHSCPHYRITLNSEARADLRAWFDFISNYNGKSCFLFQKWVSSESLKLYSDAAGVHGGYAAVFGSTWFAGEWPQNMLQLHITIKELFPIVLAVEIWGHSLSNHKVLRFLHHEIKF